MTDPRGVTIELQYSPDYNYGFLTAEIKKGIDGKITDAVGETQPSVIHSYGYDFNTGLKTWEIDPEGNLTEYEYDLLGRLTKIIYPVDEEQELIKDIPRSNLRSDDYGERRNNPVKIQFYDEEEISTTVINAIKNIDINDYRT